jgi:steroid delta-isomerase-like uncharacterized protein
VTAEPTFRAYLEAFNRGDVGAIAMLYAEPTSVRNPFSPAPLTTRDDVRAFVGSMFAAYRDLVASVEDVLTDGDRLAARLRIRARHVGALATPDGTMEGTGRVVELRTAEFLHVDGRGRIVEHERIFDRAAVMSQLDPALLDTEPPAAGDAGA